MLRAQNMTLLSKYVEDFFKFCGLLRKPKLYYISLCSKVSDEGR